MTAAALAATDLVAGYRRRRRTTPIVRADRLEAARGELTAVIGPNGTGKSTLLRTLVGAQPPLAGTVEVDERPLGQLDRQALARHLAVVLTDRVEPGRLTVGEVISLGRHPHTGWTGRLTSGDVAAAGRAAELAGVGHLWHRQFGELSDGQRQRALVGRALAQEPATIVLDEPTAFLDLPGRTGLTTTLARLARTAGVAAVVSTHDLDLALGHADRIWVVADGTVVTGAPEDLLADGTLARVFATDGLTLDPVTGLMRPALPPWPAVAVTGTETGRVLATRTIARCGVRVVGEGPDPSSPAPGTDRAGSAAADADGAVDGVDEPWAVVVDEAGWTLHCGRHEHRGATFDALARTLHTHIPRADLAAVGNDDQEDA